jgi:hypothetical protein
MKILETLKIHDKPAAIKLDKYIEKLTQKERSKLECNINKRLHVFKQSYPSNICISKDSLLKDKLVFCLKEVKKNRMKAIPRTNNL